MVVYLDTPESPEKGKKTLKTFNLVGLFQKGRKRRYSSAHRNRTGELTWKVNWKF
jgi:hypothetical protein